MKESDITLLKEAVHTIKDYPKEGILFRDVMGILENSEAFALTINTLKAKFENKGFTKIVGTEARGFLFGAPLALALGVGFVPVRKPGKLPRDTFAQDYDLEYGTDTLEIHQDALIEGDNVLIVDDLLATGGTAVAAAKLIQSQGAEILGFSFVVELAFLEGRKRLEEFTSNITSIVKY